MGAGDDRVRGDRARADGTAQSRVACGMWAAGWPSCMMRSGRGCARPGRGGSEVRGGARAVGRRGRGLQGPSGSSGARRCARVAWGYTELNWGTDGTSPSVPPGSRVGCNMEVPVLHLHFNFRTGERSRLGTSKKHNKTQQNAKFSRLRRAVIKPHRHLQNFCMGHCTRW